MPTNHVQHPPDEIALSLYVLECVCGFNDTTSYGGQARVKVRGFIIAQAERIKELEAEVLRLKECNHAD